MGAKKKFDTENRVLKLIRAFLTEIDNRPAISSLYLEASIEDDLGIDSIGRAEILRLLEREFNVSISDQALLQAEKISDIVDIVQFAQPKKASEKLGAKETSRELKIPKHANTLLQVLEHYVALDKSKVHIYLQEEDDQVNVITYGKLYDEAKRVAQGLRELRIGKCDTVAIMLPTCESFFYAFFGILYAGAIPVPIYPPFRANDIERYVKNEEKILNNAEVRALITFEKGKTVSRLIQHFIPTLKKVTTVEDLRVSDEPLPRISIKADDPALIQYTSGSTGDPKGVLLLHRNLLTNLKTVGERIHVNKDDVIVSWLPLYHDMGLIGAWLGSLYFGVPLVLHSPLSFLSHPEKWLWSIHRYRGTLSASPNFGYEFCNNKIDEKDIAGLDLSSWRLALNGAEAIYAETIRRFVEKFRHYHLNPRTIYPVYGLAESTVALSFSELEESPYIEKIDREIFTNECRAQLLRDSDCEYLEFVSCGKPLKNHEIRIVSEKNDVLSERQVGHIQFRGPSAMKGYYHNTAAVNEAYHEGWWDTGDMGYVANGDLFVTGRKKDLIIKAGHNIYPDDIELKVSELPQIRKGGVVVFGVQEEKQGTDKVVVVAEVRDKKMKFKKELRSLVLKKVKDAIGMPADRVMLVSPKTIPKTSSGKLRRSAAKGLYLKHHLETPALPAGLQFAKLLFQGTMRTVRRWLGLSMRFLYGIYVGVLLLLTMFPLWVSLFALPYKARIRMAKWMPRILIFLMGCPLHIKGSENIPHGKKTLFLSNHTSFFDAIVLQAVLPVGTLFLAKKELLKTRFVKSFIKRLGHLTITRQDLSVGEQEMKQISQALQQGKSIIIYPEGTFTYSRGLQHFKLGAFTLASENNVPICPIALKGTRDVLRGEEWLPCPGSVEVTIGEPIEPTEERWSDLTNIRDHVRNIIAEFSGEEKI